MNRLASLPPRAALWPLAVFGGLAFALAVVLDHTDPVVGSDRSDPISSVARAAPPPAPQRSLAIPFEPCPELDFDGDGVPDRMDQVPDSCGTGGCVYKIWIKDRYAGQIEGRCPFILEPRKGRANDVLARWWLGGSESVVTRYWMLGHQYRPRSDSTCTGDACTAEHWIRR